MKVHKRSLAYGIFLLLCLSFNLPLYSKTDSTVGRTPSTGSGQAPSTSSSANTNAGEVVVRQGSADAPLGSPTRAIQDLETKMDNYKTGTHLSAEERAKNAQLKREALNGTFDLRELCRLALDKHWASLSAAEQDHFVNLMTQLLEKKGILSKEQSQTQGKKFFIKYTGDIYLDATKTKARSRTQITVPKEDVEISIDYKLLKKGNEWKIFDVVVDDASLVDNYKYQFNSIITKHGYPELVSRMKKKLVDMDSKS